MIADTHLEHVYVWNILAVAVVAYKEAVGFYCFVKEGLELELFKSEKEVELLSGRTVPDQALDIAFQDHKVVLMELNDLFKAVENISDLDRLVTNDQLSFSVQKESTRLIKLKTSIA